MHPGCSRRTRLPCLSITHKYFSGRCRGKLTGWASQNDTVRNRMHPSCSGPIRLPYLSITHKYFGGVRAVLQSTGQQKGTETNWRFGIQSPGFEPRHGHVRRGNDFFKASGVEQATRLIDVCLKARGSRACALRNSNQSTLTGYTMWIVNLPLRRPYTFIVLARFSS